MVQGATHRATETITFKRQTKIEQMLASALSVQAIMVAIPETDLDEILAVRKHMDRLVALSRPKRPSLGWPERPVPTPAPVRLLDPYNDDGDIL